MIWRWRAAAAIKTNYLFSASGLEPVFRPEKSLTDGRVQFVGGRKQQYHNKCIQL